MKSKSRNKMSLYINKNSSHRNEKGIVFVIALALLAVLTLVGTIGVKSTTTDIKISSNYKTSKQAFYAAEAGAEYAVFQLRNLLNSNWQLTSSQLNGITAPAMSYYTFGTLTVTSGEQSETEITQGDFAGLRGLLQRYTITSEASLAGTNTAKEEAVLIIDDHLIPLFQFAVFYQDDLEIHPGPEMTISGRIHSNSDIYMSAVKGLLVESEISSAGDILNRRKTINGNDQDGPVEFKDGAGDYQEMAGLDSDSPDWITEAINRWDGNVKSKDHEISQLNLPMPSTSVPIDIIKPGDTLDRDDSSEPPELIDGKYYWKAGLRIIDGVAYDKNGDPIDLTDGGNNPNPLSPKTFYDQREGKDITVREVDIDLLKSNGVAIHALNDPPPKSDPNSTNDAGILYIHEKGSDRGIRLVNGSTLPDGGLTVASENPVYVLGDYNNSAIPQPASIAADAVTILSNNWDDDKSSRGLGTRIASDTTVNTTIMGGHIETLGKDYSGGLENLPRLLEDWKNVGGKKTLTFNGSLVSLWQSEQATGKWKYAGNVYKSPIRDWSFKIDFDNLIPGSPRFRHVQKVGWFQNLK